ncbi:MAG TPA: hypothetical protein DIW77_11280 [Chromatiaceae bacterium]|jgi:hypothetical protein|nr:MAG: hypothetical protein N838_14355 [Thiohalocapsa sp. PB-PSB1]HCS90601.1 hypothetical protein [Chromatiaceae bacterium]
METRAVWALSSAAGLDLGQATIGIVDPTQLRGDQAMAEKMKMLLVSESATKAIARRPSAGQHLDRS